MGTNPWFKFYGGEYLSDPKIASLSAQERSCWITLLSLAGMSSTPGIIEYLTIEVLLDKSGVPFDPYNPENWNATLGILKRFENMKMISTTEEGMIEIRNWKKRQETNLTDAERARSYRDRKKERHGNVTESVTNVTQEERRIEKNNSELRSRSIEIVDDATKAPKQVKTANAVYEPLLRWAEEERGTKFVYRSAQYKALKQAQAIGLKSVELKERWNEMSIEKFWEDKGFDWTHVVSSFNRKGV